MTTLLTAALERELVSRPDEFDEVTGRHTAAKTEPLLDPLAAVQGQLDELLSAGIEMRRTAYARDVSRAEKTRRTAQALSAFGLDATAEGGNVVVQPWSEEEDDLMNAIFALIDLRYPEPTP